MGAMQSECRSESFLAAAAKFWFSPVKNFVHSKQQTLQIGGTLLVTS